MDHKKLERIKSKSKRMPRLVRKITGSYDVWIVGGAANPKVEKPKDWDILVPFRLWKEVALLIPADARPTMFGGWKCISDGQEVDIWPGDLGDTMLCHKCFYAWQPWREVRITKMGV